MCHLKKKKQTVFFSSHFSCSSSDWTFSAQPLRRPCHDLLNDVITAETDLKSLVQCVDLDSSGSFRVRQHETGAVSHFEHLLVLELMKMHHTLSCWSLFINPLHGGFLFCVQKDDRTFYRWRLKCAQEIPQLFFFFFGTDDNLSCIYLLLHISEPDKCWLSCSANICISFYLFGSVVTPILHLF